MNVESIQIRNFISHADSTVEFGDGPLWLIHGDNGSGKSAFFDALEYSLYGTHRGGTHYANLLVKQGETRGAVQAVVWLGDERYRITHDLDATRGNLGGRIERWQTESDEWRRFNPGAGRRGVWEWLRPRLPALELFHSAIFLRQGRTAHFLRGTPAERSQRFGQLIDLSRYTDMATRATDRRTETDAFRNRVEADLRALGDISDEALAEAQASAAGANTAAESASKGRLEAEETARGAHAWAHLLVREDMLRTEEERLRGLVQDEHAIRLAATRVRDWDRASASLATYWHEWSRAAEERVAVKTAADRETELRHQLCNLEQQYGEAEAHRRDLAERQLPEARATANRFRTFVEVLQLERTIAEKRATLEVATTEVDELAGADDAFEEWKALQRAIPDLRRIVMARTEHAQALADFDEANAAAAEAQRQASAVGTALACARSDESAADEHLRAADDKVRRLEAEQAGLEARIGRRRALSGDEGECPLCGQALDSAAHVHVRSLLASEEAALTQLSVDLLSASAVRESSRGALALFRREVADQTEAESQARSNAAGAIERRSAAERHAQQCATVLGKSHAVVVTQHPGYTARVDETDSAWIDEEEDRIEAGLRNARAMASALRTSEMKVNAWQAALATLRNQRRCDVDPLGDERTTADLDARIATESGMSKDADERVCELENEEEQARKEGERLVGACAERGAAAEAAAAERARAIREVEAAEAEARLLATQLGAIWEPFLAERSRYDDERAEIDELRPKAEHLSELAEARGNLDRVEKDLNDVVTEKDAVPSPFRRLVEEAEAHAESARTSQQQATAERTRAESARDDLIERRGRATAYQQESDAAAERARTYRELSNLLRDGGPIQNEVIWREQGAIADEVNAVLTLLNDSLRVVLGDPLRRQQVAMQDLLVVDERNPIGQPRHFEFLSGGEQFRVALALALALHRRVGKDQAGTIIVDEGFGALDADRRDSLAIQMTDMSQGILSLGLAKRIIISSHSAEVQRHFPDGWHVVKQDGTATVHRPSDTLDELGLTG